MPERFPWLVVLLLLTATLGLAQDGAAVDSEAEYELASTTILCDCGCHPQSVHDCACGRAAEMRDDLRALVAQGMTGQQIIDKYVAEHGEQIRIAPTAQGFNLVAWLGPLGGLLAATVLLFLLIKRWTRTRPTDEPVTVPAAPVDERYRDRLRSALEKYE